MPRTRTQVNQSGEPFYLPAAERRQPHVARPAVGDLQRTRRRSRRSSATSPTRRSGSTTSSSPTDTTCPAPGVFARQRRQEGRRAARRLHARPRAPLLQRAVPARRRQAGPLRAGQRRRGLTQGAYDTTRAADLPVPARPAATRPTSIADNFFQAAFGGSFLNHQWLVAAATPVFADAVQDGGANDLHSMVDSNGMPTKTASTRRRAEVKDAALTSEVRRPGQARAAVRRLRRQHDPARSTSPTRRAPPTRGACRR